MDESNVKGLRGISKWYHGNINGVTQVTIVVMETASQGGFNSNQEAGL